MKTTANAKQTLFLLKEDIHEGAHGFLISPDETHSHQTIALHDLRSQMSEAQLNNCVIAVPGRQALQVYVSAPKLRGNKLEQALYWSIEPYLSTDIEQNEVFWEKAPTTDNPDQALVCAINKDLLSEWLDLLTQLNLEGCKLTTIGQLLYVSQDRETKLCHWQNQSIWLNHEGIGCFDTEFFNQLQLHEQFGCESDNVKCSSEAEQLGYLSSIFKNSKALKYTNFNTRYRPRKIGVDYFSSGSLLVASLLLVVAFSSYYLVMGHKFDQRINQNEQLLVTQYKQWFPQDKRIFNVRRQLEGKLKIGSSTGVDGGFERMLEATALGIDRHVNNYRVKQIRFNSAEGNLEVVSIFDNIEEAKLLENEIQESDFNMTIRSASQKKDGLEVGFIVSADGASL